MYTALVLVELSINPADSNVEQPKHQHHREQPWEEEEESDKN